MFRRLTRTSGMQSWYLRSWPRGPKAAAVTEVARESISAPGNVAAEPANPPTNASDSQKQLSSPSIRLTKREGASTRSLPADAATTRVNIASEISASTPDIPNSLAVVSDSGLKKEVSGAVENRSDQPDDYKAGSENISGQGEAEQGKEDQPSNQQSSWLGWLSRNPGTAQSTTESGESGDTEKPGPEASSQGKEQSEEQPPADTLENGTPTPVPPGNNTPDTPAAQKRSWLQMWGGTSNRRPNDGRKEATNQEGDHASTAPEQTTTEATIEQSDLNPEASDGPAESNTNTSRSSLWGFWYRDKPRDSTDQELKETNGEPKDSASGQASVDDNSKELKSRSTPRKKGHRTLPSGPELDVPPVGSDISNIPPSAKAKAPEAAASKQLQKALPNQLLPSFRDTFPLQERPSLLQQLGRLIHYSKEPGNKHVHLVSSPPQVKKAVAIGIHGYFPAPFIRSVIGQPTGTSVKFADMAAKAICKWTADYGYSCDVEKIALEGEGRISERGELLWKLLLNWIDDLRKADFILISCHSQGVPVAVMLVAKLISFGCVNAARIGICAMAGVNTGPFVDYRSRWISGSAGELFDFSNPNSQVSRDYSTALEAALNFGVRIVYVGSIDDQLVSLEVCHKSIIRRFSVSPPRQEKTQLTINSVFYIHLHFASIHFPRCFRRWQSACS